MDKMTAGQEMLLKLAVWLESFMVLGDPGYALVGALWAVHTWIYEQFDATPYLVITASTKQAGKSVFAELLAFLARNGRLTGGITPSAMYRLLDQFEGHMTLFFDEAESLSGAAAGMMRTVMNLGYRRGQTVPRTMPGGEVKEFPVYCPKAFTLIGDVQDTLRDRSIVVRLRRGSPEELRGKRSYYATEAGREAAALVTGLRDTLRGVKAVTVQVPEFLSGRDREIWLPLFSVAATLGVDAGVMDRLTRTAADLVAAKTAPARRFSQVQESEDEAINRSYGEKALSDVRRVLKEGESAIFSAHLVARMRSLPDAPWRTFRGEGLTAINLADLLSPYGVQPKLISRVVQKKKVVARGYQVKDIMGAK